VSHTHSKTGRRDGVVDECGPDPVMLRVRQFSAFSPARRSAQGGAVIAFGSEAAARRCEDVGARLDGIAGPFGNHLKMLCQHLLTCDEPPRMF
jgi:hypothetical protein